MKCPYCGSEDIYLDKKGFGLGKAVTGGLLLGPLGLLGGCIGKNELKCTCLSCHKSFMLNETKEISIKNHRSKQIHYESDNDLYKHIKEWAKTQNNIIYIKDIQKRYGIGYDRALAILKKLEEDKLYTNQTKNENSKEWIFGLLFIILVMYGCSLMGGDDNATKTTQAINISSKTTVSADAVWEVPNELGKGWDNTVKEFGVDGIKKINDLALKGANLIAQYNLCDEVILISHTTQSTKDNINFFIDCRDKSRFYLSEEEIINNKINNL